MKFILPAFLCIILSYSCAVRKSEPIAGPLDDNDPHIKNGREKFMMHCQKCHPGGEGGLGPAINPNPAPSFIKSFQVRHGLGVMPSFKKDEIAKKDLRDINKYLHALRSK
jgi:mono/diheme cytochrome c family protein